MIVLVPYLVKQNSPTHCCALRLDQILIPFLYIVLLVSANFLILGFYGIRYVLCEDEVFYYNFLWKRAHFD